MRAIIARLHRLEVAAVPQKRDRAAVEAILEAWRRRLGAEYQPTVYPPGWFDGGRNIAERIIRARQYHQQQSTAGTSGA